MSKFGGGLPLEKKRGKRIVSGRDTLAHLPLDRPFLFLGIYIIIDISFPKLQAPRKLSHGRAAFDQFCS